MSLVAYEPGGTVVTERTCSMIQGESECANAGPSDVVPPQSHLVVEVGGGTGPLPAGADVLFSWQARAP